MIEKLQVTRYENDYTPKTLEVINKINEIIDFINYMMKPIQIKKTNDNFTEPSDPYAKQRKWIGKLCKFRDNPACMWKYGILKEIFEDGEYPFWDIDCYEYAECEPVKPDDSLIYKGE